MFRSTAFTVLAAASLFSATAGARPPHQAPAAPTIILVHGAFADASSWDRVIPRLQANGASVVAVDNPLTSLEADVAATRRAIAAAPGKVVLVGHSWGGTVITEAGVDPKVEALVYVAAFAPDVGQTSAEQGERFPVAPGLQHLQQDQGRLSLSADTMRTDFAQDLQPALARELYAKQLPLTASALAQPVQAAAWRSRPSWYVLSRNDRMLSPQLQAATAVRIGAELRSLPSGHVSPLSEPRAVAETILEAAGLIAPAISSPQDTRG